MSRILVTGVEGNIFGAIVKHLCGVGRVIAAVAFTDVCAPGHETFRARRDAGESAAARRTRDEFFERHAPLERRH